MGCQPGMQLAFIKQSQISELLLELKENFSGLISSGRISSAYGYSQALDGTWKEYKKALVKDTIEDLILHTLPTLSDGMWTSPLGCSEYQKVMLIFNI